MKYRRIAIALLLLAANSSSTYAWTSIGDEFAPSKVQSRLGSQIDAESDKQAALRIRAGDKFSGSTWNPIEKF